jgi:hypothetical protein
MYLSFSIKLMCVHVCVCVFPIIFPFFSPFYFLKNCRNDLRKVLDESDDSLSTVNHVETTKSFTVSTTRSTTTTTAAPSTTSTTQSTIPSTTSTTTSTTTPSTTKSTSTTTQRTTKRFSAWKNSDDVPKTPKTYFSNSFSHHSNNNNQNNINGQTVTKSSLKKVEVTTTTTKNVDSVTASPATTTINPFYYGFNRLPRVSTTLLPQTPTTRQTYHTISTTSNTPRSPYFYHYLFTTTKKPDLLAHSTTHATNYEVDNNYQESSPSPPTDSKPKSSTYNPIFDIYFQQIARQKAAAAAAQS